MIQISAAIITFNEEQNIVRCLESLQGVVDEVVVVDSFSTDQTRELAKSRGARVVTHSFEGHIQQKNFALSQCTHDYVLSLDGDEALSEELKESILKVKKNWIGEGYKFNRLTNYAGHWVRHCGWYPDTKLRLVRKDLAEWRGVNPHDVLKLKSNQQEIFLKGDLLHFSYDSISDHVNQTNRFTTIAASEAFKAGARSSMFHIISRPVAKFLKDYFLKLGFLDGKYGFVICYINALSAFLKYSKIKELSEGKKI